MAAATVHAPQPVYTAPNGRPISNPISSQRLGRNGPVLLQDFHLIDLLAHFDRERIPERVVHAKGGGAFGEFEVTDDTTDVTSADFLSQIGKKTPIAVRFSTVGGEKGYAEAWDTGSRRLLRKKLVRVMTVLLPVYSKGSMNRSLR